MLNTYTNDTRAAARRHLHTWTTMLGLTTRLDHLQVEQLVTDAYGAAGLAPPRRIMWCSSPFTMSWMHSICTELWQSDVGQDVREALIEAPMRKARPSIQRSMSGEFRQSLLADLEGGLRGVARVREQALWDALTTTSATTLDDLPTDMKVVIVEALGAAGFPTSVPTQDGYGVSGLVWGPLTPLAITLDFLQRRLGLVTETQGIAPLICLLRETHGFIAHEKIFWLSEMPTVTDDDRLVYADGWTVPIDRGAS